MPYNLFIPKTLKEDLLGTSHGVDANRPNCCFCTLWREREREHKLKN